MTTASLLLSTARPSTARLASGWLATMLLVTVAAVTVVVVRPDMVLLRGTGTSTAVVLALFLVGGGLAVSAHLGTGRDFGLWCAPLAVAVLVATPAATVLGAGLAALTLSAWVQATGSGSAQRRRAGMLPGSQIAFAGALAVAEAGVAVAIAHVLLEPSDVVGWPQVTVGLLATVVAYMTGRGVVGALNGRHLEDSVMSRIARVIRGLPLVTVAGAAALLGLIVYLAAPEGLALVAVLAAAGGWAQRHHLRVVADRDRLAHLFSLAADLAMAHTVDEAMSRLLRQSAQVLGATRAEVIFFTPPNKLIHAVSFQDGDVRWPDIRVPESTRELVTTWALVDPHARQLGTEDAHPLRQWMREQGLKDALICPFVYPEPHGVLILANHEYGHFGVQDLRTAEGFAAHGLETLLRTRREEILAEIESQHGDLSQPGMIDRLTGLPDAGILNGHLTRLTARQTAGVGIAVISLDDVPEVVGGQGQAATDVMLQEVGRRLMNAVRRTDLIARLDDRRFALVMTGLDDVAMAMTTCERLAGQISRPIAHGGQILTTGASIGLSMAWDPLGQAGESGGDHLAQACIAEQVARADSIHAVRLYTADLQQPTA